MNDSQKESEAESVADRNRRNSIIRIYTGTCFFLPGQRLALLVRASC